MARLNSEDLMKLEWLVCRISDEEDKRIVVQGPSRPVAHPDKRADKAAQKALEEERFGLLQVSDKVGAYFSVSMLMTGLLLVGVFTYMMATDAMDWFAISPDMPFLGVVVWVFAGIANVLGGLLLMGSQ